MLRLDGKKGWQPAQPYIDSDAGEEFTMEPSGSSRIMRIRAKCSRYSMINMSVWRLRAEGGAYILSREWHGAADTRPAKARPARNSGKLP